MGDRPISLPFGVRYWADAPEGGPDGKRCRSFGTFLFPR